MIIDRPANRPFDQYPRNVAKRSIDYMKELGIADEMIVGPEYEFYVFDRVEYSTRPEASGFRVDTRQAQWSTGNNGYQVPGKPGTTPHCPRMSPRISGAGSACCWRTGGSESSTTTLK